MSAFDATAGQEKTEADGAENLVAVDMGSSLAFTLFAMRLTSSLGADRVPWMCSDRRCISVDVMNRCLPNKLIEQTKLTTQDREHQWKAH
eukprot:m.281998 g.281998  ORF g.281998 m.281998 type:complete len:90 (-) comp157800_c0_seq1:30-299(-)